MWKRVLAFTVDYYDLWRILRDFGPLLKGVELNDLLRRKSAHHRVSYSSLDDFFTAELEAEARRNRDGGRFIDLFYKGIAYESKTGFQNLTKGIAKQIAKDEELLRTKAIQGAECHFFRSPKTGLMGLSTPLENALIKAGIKIVKH